MVIMFLSHQPHLPVDAVLEAECVGRSAEDWQLQNEPLDRRRTFLLFDLTQKKPPVKKPPSRKSQSATRQSVYVYVVEDTDIQREPVMPWLISDTKENQF